MEFNIIEWVALVGAIVAVVGGIAAMMSRKIQDNQQANEANRLQDLELTTLKTEVENIKVDIIELKQNDGLLEDKLLQQVKKLEEKMDKVNDLLLQLINKQ